MPYQVQHQQDPSMLPRTDGKEHPSYTSHALDGRLFADVPQFFHLLAELWAACRAGRHTWVM